MEKLKAKNLKLVYYDGVISLYKVGPGNKKPIIFINDQMDHRLQALETLTDLPSILCYRYANTYMYDENIHTPYIMVYDYPIHGVVKSRYNTQLFTRSLREGLWFNRLEDVDIMGIGVGGIIGMRASCDKRVDQVRSIHPPFLSSPLVNFRLLEDYYYSLDTRQRIIYYWLTKIVDPTFGFQRENAFGYEEIVDKIDLDKIKVFGSSINDVKGFGFLSKELADLIYKVSGLKSDGVVCYDRGIYEKYGFDVITDDKPHSHFDLGSDSEYIKGVYKTLSLKK